ncbi:MAG: signal peptide peptidase SppA [candidate division Zixibacteria bacterium]|nr:signal peptide peptidase SppA [candidate division Zixibacteria bacterium]MDD5427291.1 signal peptide peptidase SppA [candidate division Zixibacteria bacterium]
MARRRDVIIGIIIALSFIFAFGFFVIFFLIALTGGGELKFAGMGGNVGVVEMFGIIDENSGREIIRQLDDWADNSSIKAVVVHINSPGGGVAISQEVYDAILRLRNEKPVVASMASVAASGGYMISCAADRIVANPGTITGSIGVLMQYYTYYNLFDKVGLGTETIKSGELKDVGSPTRPMTDQEELMLRSVVMDSYEQFVEVVATGRQMEKENVYPLADGSIFTGLQAFNLGLVDTLGGLKEAVDLAANLAEIKGEPRVVKPYRREKLSIFDLLGNILENLNKKVENSTVGPQLLFLYQ